MPNHVMYIIANQDLEMSSGKLSAQVAHAAVRAYEKTDRALRQQWLIEGETKIVLQARDEAHMRNIVEYIKHHLPDLEPCVVIDEGRTEVPPLSMTAMAFPVLDKDAEAVKFAFGTLKLYKDKPVKSNPNMACLKGSTWFFANPALVSFIITLGLFVAIGLL